MSAGHLYSAITKIGFPLFSRNIASVVGLEHLPTSGGYIIAANHVDWLDGFYISTAIGRAIHRPVYFLAKSKTYAWTTAIIPMPEHKPDSVDQSVGHLHSGKILVVFPEGERNAEAQLRPGKTGAVRMAVGAGVPILPLGLTCFAGQNVGQSLMQTIAKKHPVRVAIGQPLSFTLPANGISSEWLSTETRRLMEAIAPLCHKSV